MVTWVDTNITQGACAYPITSSTTMGTGYETEVSQRAKKFVRANTLAPRAAESEHFPRHHLRRLRARGRSRHQFHRRPGSRADEGDPLHHFRQAPARGVSHRSARPDQPFAQCPLRPRRRDERVRLRLGDFVRPQRPGSLRPRHHLPPRRRGLRNPVHERAGWFPHHPYHREHQAARARVHEEGIGDPNRRSCAASSTRATPL